MKLLEGASECASPHRESCKPQEVFVEVFLVGGPLSIWRGVYVDLSRRPGGAVSYSGPPRYHGNRDDRTQPTNGSRQQKEARCDVRSSENPGGTSEEGKNCSLHFLSLKFLHPMKQVAVRKRKG